MHFEPANHRYEVTVTQGTLAQRNLHKVYVDFSNGLLKCFSPLSIDASAAVVANVGARH